MTKTLKIALALNFMNVFFPAYAEEKPSTDTNEEGWLELFNGENLAGWTAKISGQPLGQDPLETFRVDGGLLSVDYSNYEEFSGQFGHLFYSQPFSYYRLLIEYRFVGEQLEGGPSWAKRNSGVMLHSQDPTTMTLAQDFPHSFEAQFLGGLNDGKARTTGNICSPGTEVCYLGRQLKSHCQASQSKTLDGDQWVSVEIVVDGSNSVIHLVNGEEVIRYANLRLSESKTGANHATDNSSSDLGQGYIAIQSESHPIDFRRIAIKILAQP